MIRRSTLTHEFVEHVPDVLVDGTVYVSVRFATAVHLCCCGCGNEIVTPISPADWHLNFDGASVSLYPSIGNWSLRCRSHYWIRKNRVVWAHSWTAKEIAAGRAFDRHAIDAQFAGVDEVPAGSPSTTAPVEGEPRLFEALWRKLRRLWS
jgi:hypothetical protein